MIAMLLAAMSFSAQAISLKFYFTVESSGPSIYACNAGIKHKGYSENVCYDRETYESCQPGTCQDAKECNCVCTGTAGSTRLDFMKANFAEWTDNGEPIGTTSTKSEYAPTNKYNEIFSNRQEWGNQLTNLDFRFGSERYGTEFFLDVCYRGPQIEYYEAGNTGSSSPNFLLNSQVTLTDIITNNGLAYSKVAGLETRVQVTCDVQGSGSYVYAHDGSGNYDDALAHDIEGISGGTVNFDSGWTNFSNGSNLNLLNKWINVNNVFTPRFCKVRYFFKEGSRDSSNPLDTIRKWQHQKAEVCTYTDINEDIQ